MAARYHADDPAFAAQAGRGVTPPLLPTLVMAAILGAASYLCHEPAGSVMPAPLPRLASAVPSSGVLASAVPAAPEAVAEAPFIPAPLAFRTQFPLSVPPLPLAVAQAEAAPVLQAHRPAARIAARPLARPAEAPRGIAKVSPAADKARVAPDRAASPPGGPLPYAAEDEDVSTAVADADEGLLPAIALPFAPTIRAVTQAGAAAGTFVSVKGAALGAETVILGSAVSGWVGRLR